MQKIIFFLIKKKIPTQEKERQLDAKNIYSNRFLGGKPSSYSGTPAESPAASFRTNLLKKKSGSVSDLTPRDKAKAYEEKRRAGQEKKEKEKVRRDFGFVFFSLLFHYLQI